MSGRASSSRRGIGATSSLSKENEDLIQQLLIDGSSDEDPEITIDINSSSSSSLSSLSSFSSPREISLEITNVVAKFDLKCMLNLKDIAERADNVELRHDGGVSQSNEQLTSQSIFTSMKTCLLYTSDAADE